MLLLTEHEGIRRFGRHELRFAQIDPRRIDVDVGSCDVGDETGNVIARDDGGDVVGTVGFEMRLHRGPKFLDQRAFADAAQAAAAFDLGEHREGGQAEGNRGQRGECLEVDHAETRLAVQQRRQDAVASRPLRVVPLAIGDRLLNGRIPAHARDLAECGNEPMSAGVGIGRQRRKVDGVIAAEVVAGELALDGRVLSAPVAEDLKDEIADADAGNKMRSPLAEYVQAFLRLCSRQPSRVEMLGVAQCRPHLYQALAKILVHTKGGIWCQGIGMVEHAVGQDTMCGLP